MKSSPPSSPSSTRPLPMVPAADGQSHAQPPATKRQRAAASLAADAHQTPPQKRLAAHARHTPRMPKTKAVPKHTIGQLDSRPPDVPVEIALLIFAALKPNPMQLMAFIQAEIDATTPSVWSAVAQLNELWASFSPRLPAAETLVEGAYAKAFMRRYKAKSSFVRQTLDALWRAHDKPDMMLLRNIRNISELAEDFDIIRAAVGQFSLAYRFAKSDLQRDPVIAYAAVSHFGWLLQDVDASLQRDARLVRAAVRQSGQHLAFAHESLQRDPALRALAGWPPLTHG